MKTKINALIITTIAIFALTDMVTAGTLNFGIYFRDVSGNPPTAYHVRVRVVLYDGSYSNWFIDNQISGYPTGGWQPSTTYSGLSIQYSLPSPNPEPADFCYLQVEIWKDLTPELRASSSWKPKSDPINFGVIDCGIIY